MSSTSISTKKEDYLDEDPPIKNQNYCLLSFISPDEVLINKETYYLKYFFKKLSDDLASLYNGLKSKYPDDIEFINNIKDNHKYLDDYKIMDEQYKYSKSINYNIVEKEFHEDNNFRTTIQGIKVRGVFDTINEAKNRCEFLKKKDKNHNIFIGQIGCWCPWSPNPNELENQEYSETELNTLMKEYKQNMNSKDEIFENRRKNSIINSTITEEDDKYDKKDEDDTSNLRNDIDKLSGVFTEDDPWTKKKNESNT